MAVRIKGLLPSECLARMVARRGETPLTLKGEPVPAERIVYVGAPSKWCNPFSHRARSSARWLVESRQAAVDAFRIWIADDEQAALREDILSQLAGKVLVCTCQAQHAVGPPCHAEVLVRLANPWLADLEADEQRAETARKLDLRYASHFREWRRREGLEDRPVLLVTGDRDFAASKVVEEHIRTLGPGHVVIEGEARGADVLARDAALANGIPVGGFPARWQATRTTPAHRIRTYGTRQVDIAAGPIRNGIMAECEPDLVLAFHDDLASSRGTLDMVRRAVNAGRKVVLANSQGELRDVDDVYLRELTGAADVED